LCPRLSEECHQEGKARRLLINSPTCVQEPQETQNPLRNVSYNINRKPHLQVSNSFLISSFYPFTDADGEKWLY